VLAEEKEFATKKTVNALRDWHEACMLVSPNPPNEFRIFPLSPAWPKPQRVHGSVLSVPLLVDTTHPCAPSRLLIQKNHLICDSNAVSLTRYGSHDLSGSPLPVVGAHAKYGCALFTSTMKGQLRFYNAQQLTDARTSTRMWP
jgi:hypothetical protein